MPFGMEELEWLGYPMVKNFEDRIHERDRRTDRQTQRHRMTAKAVLARQK